jgi:hypothetical protein
MRRAALIALAATLVLGVAACGDDDDDTGTGETTTSTTGGDETTTTAGEETTTTSEAASSGVLTLFPADDVEDAPEDAAQGFMDRYFPGASFTLGDFAEGDSQSGEIEVLGGGEGGGGDRLRTTLLLRQVDGGWHVIAAVNENVAITSPEAQAEIPAGEPVTVEGVGRGFEATILVRVETIDGSVLLGDIGSGGSGATPEPFSVTIDLGDDDLTGQTLAVIARGDTGLEDDPGEFSAIPVAVV